MTTYKSTKADSRLSGAEFIPVSDGNFSFFYLKNPADKGTEKQWLQSIGQEIVAESLVDGQPVLVTHGQKTKEELQKLLTDRGESLALDTPKKPFNFWALRGGMSIIGQSLQLASSLTQVEKLTESAAILKPGHPHHNPHLKPGMWVRKAFSPDLGVFAILNLIANAANIVYGGQKEEGENRLKHVKGMLNEGLEDHLTNGDTPLGIDEKRAELHKGPQPPKTFSQKFNEFAERNSVRFFEIGLRYVAAIALVLPFKKSKLAAGWSELRKGSPIKAYNAAKNTDWIMRTAGWGYLTGKALALFTKVPDPYEDKPHTLLDTIREKVVFKVGGLIESAAGAFIAVNAFKNRKVGRPNDNTPDIKPHIDYLSGVGGMLFAGGYIVRMWAPFGEKQVNMAEVYAHATDTLAKTPPEQLPQLMADTAATLKEHFKDKPVSYGEIFTKMMTDLYRYQHIALDNLGTEPEERKEKLANGHATSAPVESKGSDGASPEDKYQIRRRMPTDVVKRPPIEPKELGAKSAVAPTFH